MLCSGPFRTQLIHFFYIPSYVRTTCTQDFWILITWLPKSGLAKTRLAGPVSPPLKYQCLGLISYLVYVDNYRSWQSCDCMRSRRSCDCMRSHDGHVTVWDHMTVMWLWDHMTVMWLYEITWRSCDCMKSHDGHVTVWDHMTVMWLWDHMTVMWLWDHMTVMWLYEITWRSCDCMTASGVTAKPMLLISQQNANSKTSPNSWNIFWAYFFLWM